MMIRRRLILREEAFRGIKTLKRLERTNSSVRIDRMDDYQAIYHETSDAQLISFDKQCAFALMAKARQSFLNLLNPNHLFPRANTDCL
jgi:hypothetical protein